MLVIFSGIAITLGGNVSPILNFVNLLVILNSDCAKVFGTTQIISSTLCTSGAGFKGACGGDSGGPLVYKEADGFFTQIGVVSFGSFNCSAGLPSAFARVTSFMGWISTTSGVAVRP